MSETVTPSMVKELRDRSGVGMAKCKEALDEAKGNMDKAIEILRKAGMTSSVKKEGRETKEGAIGFDENSDGIALVEVNSETDFVAQNEKFRKFLSDLCKILLLSKECELKDFNNKILPSDKSLTVEQYRNLLIQSIGENIQIKRIEYIAKSPKSFYGIYSHMKGKILSIVEMFCDGCKSCESCEAVAKDIAMHVVASEPDYLEETKVPNDVKEREIDIVKFQIKDKPQQVIDKIIAGKLKAFYSQVCLLDQPFVKENESTVRQYVENQGKKLGCSLIVKRFWRWKIAK